MEGERFSEEVTREIAVDVLRIVAVHGVRPDVDILREIIDKYECYTLDPDGPPYALLLESLILNHIIIQRLANVTGKTLEETVDQLILELS